MDSDIFSKMEGLHGDIPKMNWEHRDLVSAWKTFNLHCDFMFSGPLKRKSDGEKSAYLMIWVGEHGREVFGTWDLSEEDKGKPEEIRKRFSEYVEPKSNVVFNRYKFQCRVQQEGESCDQFITDLKILSADCDYGEEKNKMVRDRIVFGTASLKVREKLINEGSHLSLEKAVEICRTFEISQKQLKTMSGEEAATGAVNAIRKENKKTASKNSKQKKSVTKCSRCGLTHEKLKCPAYGKSCKKCGKKNHFAVACKTQMKKGEHSINELNQGTATDYDSDEIFVGALYSNKQEDVFTEVLSINGCKIKFQLDTGARCNVLSVSDYKRIRHKKQMKKPEVVLRSFSGHKLVPEGTITLDLLCKEEERKVKFHVVETQSTSIISGQTAEEIGLIKRIYQVETKYSDMFEGLGCIPGEYSIKINKEVEPVVHPPRKVPVALRQKVKEELARMESLGVIQKQTEPTPWVNSMVTVTKPNGSLRICIDPKDLNKAIQREHYPMQTIEQVVADMPDAKVFSTLDATSGFWQMKLDEESSKLTTFNTPYGRYRFTRAPFGIKSIPEIFQRAMSEMLEGLEGTAVIIDDILVWGKDQSEHDHRLNKLFERAKAWNLRLSASKCQFRKDEVEYVGHKLTKDGLKADPEKVRAVLEMSSPQNKKELQTFLGFITYLQKFLPHMSEVSAPLRILLKKDVQWHWELEQDESFKRLKSLASESPVLAFYNKDEDLILNVDSSSNGLGAVLLQNGKPIAYASRALNNTQKKYAQIEKEALAIVFGCEKFHQYVYGRHFVVESDHKPLEYIFHKPISEAPQRVQRFALTLLKYDFEVKHKPGSSMFISDTLSRLYLNETKEKLVPDVEINEIQLNAHLPMSPKEYNRLKEETEKDQDLKLLALLVEEGWPEKKSRIPQRIAKYWQFRHEITCVDGILFKGQKVIIPGTLRADMLRIVHETHMGIVKCKQRARQFMYWPGMISQIQETVEKCTVCAQCDTKANRKETLITSKIPNRPSAKLGADLFEFKGQHFLLTVDYYSKWPEVEKLDNLTSSNVIAYLKKQFSRFGFIDELVTDNGPQFSSTEFKKFADEYGFVHTTTSPHYAQANGQVERYVQTVKNLIRKSNDPYKAMLDYRNSPLDVIGLSPAQLHLGRVLKSALPATAEVLKPNYKGTEEIEKQHERRQERLKFYYNKNKNKMPLKPLNDGKSVMIKHNQGVVPGTVIKKHHTPRSYIVETQDGRQLRRNRIHLKPTKASFQPSNQEISYKEQEIRNSPNKNVNISENRVSENRECEKSVKSKNVPKCLFESSHDISENSSSEEIPSRFTSSGREVKMPSKYSDYMCN